MHGFQRVDEVVWELPADARPDMRVPARVFADQRLIEQIAADRSLEQLQNVATLPGISGAALAMPDIHQGYGFPVGGVAATEPPDGVVSPGGVGYDINCGVRLLALPLTVAELGSRAEALVHEISRRVPVGAGHGGSLKLARGALDRVLTQGPRVLLAEHGIGTDEDIGHTEIGGLPAGRRSGGGVGASPSQGRRSARDARLGQPLPRAAARREDPRSGERAGVWLTRRPGDGADPFRLARARPSGMHRLRAPDGRGAEPLWDHAPGPAARVRTPELGGGAPIPGRDGVCGELRVG